jgi:hypothetical protein
MKASHALRDEDGSTLIAVVGIMVVLTILVIGAFSMSSDNLFQSRRDRGSAQALSAAEAALEQSTWRLAKSVGTTSALTLTLPTGTASVTATKTTSMTWTLTARGASLTTPTAYRTITTDLFMMNIWDMDFIDGPMGVGGCGKFNGGASFTGAWYIEGDWPDTKGQVSFNGGPYFVKGGDIPAGHANFGTDGKLVDIYCDGTVDPGLTNVRVHNYCPTIPIPKQGLSELQAARQTAINESADNLQGSSSTIANDECRVSGISTGLPSPRSGSGYKVVDNDSVVNTSVVSVTIGSGVPSFGKPYDAALGHSPDDFAWDAATGVLTVQGTVFIDAKDLNLTGVTWAGKGTIICSGRVNISGSWAPYVMADYPGTGSSHPANVGISASDDINVSASPCYGPFFSSTLFSNDAAGNKAEFYGEIVAPICNWAMHATVVCTPNMSQNLPPSMPAGLGPVPVMTGWHEGIH